MSADHIIALIDTYKYFILFPIAILEGHIISLIVGFLARLGTINPYIAGAVIMSGNLTGDSLLYLAGYYKGERFLNRWGKYVGITFESIEKSKKLFERHHNAILFVSKLTNGFGLIMAILFTAGLAKVPFRSYLFWNFLGELLWTSGLITLGYIFGHLYIQVEGVISKIGLVVGVFVVGFLVFRFQQYIVAQYKNRLL